MRKTLALLITLSFASIMFADMVVPISQLPKSAQNFIQKTFPGAQIYIEAVYHIYAKAKFCPAEKCGKVNM